LGSATKIGADIFQKRRNVDALITELGWDIEYRKGDTTSVVTKKEIDDYFQRLKTIHNAAEESLNRVYST
jgi:hypothetical protein